MTSPANTPNEQKQAKVEFDRDHHISTLEMYLDVIIGLAARLDIPANKIPTLAAALSNAKLYLNYHRNIRPK